MSNRRKAKIVTKNTAVSTQNTAAKRKTKDSLASLEDLAGAFAFIENPDMDISDEVSTELALAVGEAVDNSPLAATGVFRNIGLDDDISGLSIVEEEMPLEDPVDDDGCKPESAGSSNIADTVLVPAKPEKTPEQVAKEHLVGELVKYVKPDGGDASAVPLKMLEVMTNDEIEALLALYEITYSGLNKANADGYASQFIARIVNSAQHQSNVELAQQYSRELLTLAQKVQRTLDIDVVVKSLTADKFANAAVEAINDNSVLRSAICELGRAFNHPSVPTKADVATLKTLINILMQAAAHMHTIPGFRDRAQEALTRMADDLKAKDITIAELKAKLADKQTQEALAIEVAVQTARVFPKSSDLPRSLLITDGKSKFLCYVSRKGKAIRGKPDAPLLCHVGWTTNMARAIGFANKTEAVGLVERVILLETAENPMWAAGMDVKLRGVDIRSLRYARAAAIFAERV